MRPREAKMPRFYFDLAKARKSLATGETPVDAGSWRALRDGRRARDARGRGLPAHLRASRGVRAERAGRSPGPRLRALCRPGTCLADGHRGVAAGRCRLGGAQQGHARAAPGHRRRPGPPGRADPAHRPSGRRASRKMSSPRSSVIGESLAELGREVDVEAATARRRLRQGENRRRKRARQRPYRGREGPRRRASRTRGSGPSGDRARGRLPTPDLPRRFSSDPARLRRARRAQRRQGRLPLRSQPARACELSVGPASASTTSMSRPPPRRASSSSTRRPRTRSPRRS